MIIISTYLTLLLISQEINSQTSTAKQPDIYTKQKLKIVTQPLKK